MAHGAKPTSSGTAAVRLLAAVTPLRYVRVAHVCMCYGACTCAGYRKRARGARSRTLDAVLVCFVQQMPLMTLVSRRVCVSRRYPTPSGVQPDPVATGALRSSLGPSAGVVRVGEPLAPQASRAQLSCVKDLLTRTFYNVSDSAYVDCQCSLPSGVPTDAPAVTCTLTIPHIFAFSCMEYLLGFMWAARSFSFCPLVQCHTHTLPVNVYVYACAGTAPRLTVSAATTPPPPKV